MKAILLGFSYFNLPDKYLPSTASDILLMSKKYQDSIIISDNFQLKKKLYCSDLENIVYHLNKVKSKEILFYFTGHGVPEGLLLPNGTVLEYHYLKKFLEKRFDKITLILDCCHASNFELRWKLKKNDWIQHKTVEDHKNFLSITAESYNGKSKATNNYSLLTFHLCNQPEVNIHLKKKINKDFKSKKLPVKMRIYASTSYLTWSEEKKLQ